MNSISKAITTKALRESWADAKRAAYLMEREFERSFRKDPVGRDYLVGLLQIVVNHLKNDDKSLQKTEEQDLAVSMAGSNNFNVETYERKLAVMMPEYKRLMRKEGFDVELVKRPIVIATLVERKEA